MTFKTLNPPPAATGQNPTLSTHAVELLSDLTESLENARLYAGEQWTREDLQDDIRVLGKCFKRRARLAR